jgi:hypothetical protein
MIVTLKQVGTVFYGHDHMREDQIRMTLNDRLITGKVSLERLCTTTDGTKGVKKMTFAEVGALELNNALRMVVTKNEVRTAGLYAGEKEPNLV